MPTETGHTARPQDDVADALTVRQHRVPLSGPDIDSPSAGSWQDDLLALIGDARIVLLGESTHGSREFYQTRACISRRLIAEGGFDVLAVEADWPAALAVSRHVQGRGDDLNTALSAFGRFPLWMWRNQQVLEFAQWLRQHNDALPFHQRIGFFGLDLYSLPPLAG